MSFLGLGQGCVGHSEASTDPSASCCPGYIKWNYDANTGVAYQGFMCWTAGCASEGQFAPPSGIGGPGCCSGLVNSNGRCAKPVASGGGGGTPITYPPACKGTIVCDLDDMWVYGGIALLGLLALSGGKK